MDDNNCFGSLHSLLMYISCASWCYSRLKAFGILLGLKNLLLIIMLTSYTLIFLTFACFSIPNYHSVTLTLIFSFKTISDNYNRQTDTFACTTIYVNILEDV